MEITPDNLEWSSDDSLNLTTFLNTATGRRFLPKLAEHAPVLLASGDTNAILVRNGQLLGFQVAIQTVLSLCRVSSNSATAVDKSYPDLNNDAAWEGLPGAAGEKLTIEQL